MKRTLVLLCAQILITLGGGQDVFAATYQYSAETTAPARRQGMVSASGFNWNCQGTRCSAGGSSATPSVAVCNALAVQVGPLRSYGHKGGMFSPGELQQCNAGVPAVQSVGAPITLPRVPKPVPPAPGAPPPPSGAPQATATGLNRSVTSNDFTRLAQPIPPVPNKVSPLTSHSKAASSLDSIAITTPPLRYIGQGPVVINANTLHYAGQGPVVINADALRYVGERPVVIAADTLRYSGPNRIKPNIQSVVVSADTLHYAGQGPVVINADILRYTGQNSVVITTDVLRY